MPGIGNLLAGIGGGLLMGYGQQLLQNKQEQEALNSRLKLGRQQAEDQLLIEEAKSGNQGAADLLNKRFGDNTGTMMVQGYQQMQQQLQSIFPQAGGGGMPQGGMPQGGMPPMAGGMPQGGGAPQMGGATPVGFGGAQPPQMGGGGMSPTGGMPQVGMPQAGGGMPGMPPMVGGPAGGGSPIAALGGQVNDITNQLTDLTQRRQKLAIIMASNPETATQFAPIAQALDQQMTTLRDQYNHASSQMFSAQEHADTEAQENARFDVSKQLQMLTIQENASMKQVMLANARAQQNFNDQMRLSADDEKRSMYVQNRANNLSQQRLSLQEKFNATDASGNPKYTEAEKKAAAESYNKAADQLGSMSKKYKIDLGDLGINPNDLKIQIHEGDKDTRTYVFGLPVPMTGKAPTPAFLGEKDATSAAPTAGSGGAPAPAGKTKSGKQYWKWPDGTNHYSPPSGA